MFVDRSLELVQYLQKLDFLTAVDIELIQSKIEIRSTRRNQYLLHAGETIRELYFVLEGLVRSSTIDNEREVTTWIATPGRFIIEANSFIRQQPAILNLQVIRRGQVAILTHDALIELNIAIPLWKDFIIEVISEYNAVLQQLYLFCLVGSARERYEKMYAIFPEYFKQVPLKYLADILHIKPETLSRIRMW